MPIQTALGSLSIRVVAPPRVKPTDDDRRTAQLFVDLVIGVLHGDIARLHGLTSRVRSCQLFGRPLVDYPAQLQNDDQAQKIFALIKSGRRPFYMVRPIIFAALLGDVAVCKHLIEDCAANLRCGGPWSSLILRGSDNLVPLDVAVRTQKEQVAKYILLKSGFVVLDRILLLWITPSLNFPVGLLLSLDTGAAPVCHSAYGSSVLATAIKRDNCQATVLLLHRGADPMRQSARDSDLPDILTRTHFQERGPHRGYTNRVRDALDKHGLGAPLGDKVVTRQQALDAIYAELGLEHFPDLPMLHPARRRLATLLRFRHAHDAQLDARLAVMAASEGRPLELAKRLRLGHLAGCMERKYKRSGDGLAGTEGLQTLEELARERGHEECAMVVTEWDWQEEYRQRRIAVRNGAPANKPVTNEEVHEERMKQREQREAERARQREQLQAAGSGHDG